MKHPARTPAVSAVTLPHFRGLQLLSVSLHVRFLEEGNVEEAETQKQRIEQLQRDRRRVLEENNVEHQPRFFRWAPGSCELSVGGSGRPPDASGGIWRANRGVSSPKKGPWMGFQLQSGDASPLRGPELLGHWPLTVPASPSPASRSSASFAVSQDAEPSESARKCSVSAYRRSHKTTPTRPLWPASSVNPGWSVVPHRGMFYTVRDRSGSPRWLPSREPGFQTATDFPMHLGLEHGLVI